MPYKNTTLKIQEKDDKRVKLTASQRVEIYNLYNVYGAYSQRELAAMFGVSRRLITFITDPAKHKANLAIRDSKKYYDKDANTIAMKTHRDHKQRLYLKGELV